MSLLSLSKDERSRRAFRLRAWLRQAL